MSQDRKHTRRWLQFGLGTWFIVVAILTWGLATRPYRVMRATLLDWAATEQWMLNPSLPPSNLPKYCFLEPSAYGIVAIEYPLNPRLAYPASAFVAFIAWKTARRIGASRDTAAQCDEASDRPVQPIRCECFRDHCRQPKRPRLPLPLAHLVVASAFVVFQVDVAAGFDVF